MSNFTKAQTGVSANSSGTSIAVSLASNPGTGHVVCVGVHFYDGTSTPATLTVADGATPNNSYTVDTTSSGSTNMSTAGQIFLAYLIGTPSNAHKTITATFNKSAIASAIYVDDFASAGAPALDSAAQFAGGSGGGTITSPTIPVTTADDLLYWMGSSEDHFSSVNSPWTANEGGSQLGGFAGWILSANTNTTANFNNAAADAWNSLGVSFKASSSSALSYYPRGAPVASGYTRRYRGVAI